MQSSVRTHVPDDDCVSRREIEETHAEICDKMEQLSLHNTGFLIITYQSAFLAIDFDREIICS